MRSCVTASSCAVMTLGPGERQPTERQLASSSCDSRLPVSFTHVFTLK
jgi:hypothetical protein